MASTFLTILQSMISVLGGAIVGLAEKLGTGIVALVTNIMFVTNETGAVTDLNAFGYTIVVFGGISLAIGLSYKIYNFIISLGAKK